jgi:hypothetical protein
MEQEHNMSRHQNVEALEATESAAVEVEVTETTEVSILKPFGAAKLVNARLAEVAEETGLVLKDIPPQMMYNYTSNRLNKGENPLIAYTREGGVDREAFATWLDGYIVKRVEKARTEAAKLEAELAGESDEVTDEVAEPEAVESE